MDQLEFLKMEKDRGAARLAFARPKHNVLNIEMMHELNGLLEELLKDDELKCLVIAGEGPSWSAGVDVGEHMGDLAPKMIETFHGIFRRMAKIGVLTVASVYGSCLGGGCELAVFCDLVIASESAKLGQPEIQVGVFPPIAAQIMPRSIGRKAANDLIFSGRIISADESLSLGLVNKVVKEEDLETETEGFIKPYLKLSAEVLRLTKKALTAGLMDDLEPSLKVIEDIYLRELMESHDAHEGLKAFLEKRKPEWKNE